MSDLDDIQDLFLSHIEKILWKHFRIKVLGASDNKCLPGKGRGFLNRETLIFKWKTKQFRNSKGKLGDINDIIIQPFIDTYNSDNSYYFRPFDIEVRFSNRNNITIFNSYGKDFWKTDMVNIRGNVNFIELSFKYKKEDIDFKPFIRNMKLEKLRI